MAHTLPALPYAPEALEPHIDAQTMNIHHGKHHQAYVTNLNAAIEKAPELASWSLDDLCRKIDEVPEAVRTAVRNNGGGHWNHSLFWQLMAPNAVVVGAALARSLESDLAAANDEITRLRAEVEAKQARIDALMLEHCPDEMTQEQTDNWKAHQRPREG